MAKPTLETRMEMLEKTVDGPDGVVARLDRVETCLGRVETEVHDFRGEFLQFREETRGEFSAVRAEMATGFASVRGEMATGFASVRAEMATGFASVRAEMAAEFGNVRSEMAEGFASAKQDVAETRSQMRALHEEVIGRIALLQEGRAMRAQTRRPRKKR